MSKSTPTSSTTVSQPNQEQILQAQYLGGLWGDARRLSGGGGEVPVGNEALQAINQTTGNNYNATVGPAGNVMPAAENFASQILGGRYPQASLPAGPQTRNLDTVGGTAYNTALDYGNRIRDTAYSVPDQVASNVGGLNALAGQFAPLAGTGYQLGGALSGLAPAAMNAANPAMSGLYGNAGMGISGNPIFDSLRGMASGQFVDPSRNPALAGTLRAATEPLVNQFMTATAPLTASGFEGAGRYGSGALRGAQNQNQYGLGQALANATSGVVNNAYNTGLQSMLGAGQALGGAYNTGIGNITSALGTAGQLGQAGIQNAGNLIGQAGQTIGNLAQTGLGGASSALQAGGALNLNSLQALMSGLSGAAGVANQGFGTSANATNQAGALANAGALGLGSIAQMAPELANYPLTQAQTQYNNAWQPIQNYASLLGAPVQGTPSSTSTTGQAYSNVGSQVAGGLSSLASLATLFKI